MRIMMILLVLAIVAGSIVLVTSDGDQIQDIKPSVSGDASKISGGSTIDQNGHFQSDQNQDTSLVKGPIVDEQEVRRQLMHSKFSDLKEIRKKIKMRVSRLSSRLRRSEFPPEQARTISQDMRQAGYLLKNPKLLGAFSSPEEIEQEFIQLSDVNVKLDSIKQVLDEKKNKQL